MLSKTVKNAVFERANLLCEYCRSPMDFTHQSFEIDHIQPISKLGSDDMENLACACGGCNAFKHNKTHGKDPLDNHLTSFFHPRQMLWNTHFAWSEDYLNIIGLTNIGRTTVKTLQLNRIGLVNIRRLLLLDGTHPPN
jgi:hypothetical protein